jgi:carboxyl-terminal processing protease
VANKVGSMETNMTTKGKGLWLGVGLTVGVALTATQGVLALKSDNEFNGGVAYQEVIALTQVMRRVREQYVEPVEDAELLKNAIRGMLEGLDPHSSYLDAEAFEDMNISTSGQFGGLGIEVTMQDGFVRVVTPLDDTPAKAAGMEPGDIIIRLDDKPVKGLTLREAVNIMRGKPGEKIVLTVVREGEAAPFNVDIVRDVIKVTSVKQRMLDDGIGYVRITQFQGNTGSNMLKALKTLENENKDPLKGLVLDLRNNPGGVLNAAVDVSDAFLEGGLVVYIQGRDEASRRDYNAGGGDKLKGAPVVVLINEGSASASEIVAGALQDRHRAVIMGRKSFGKGSVQTIMPLSEKSAIKLTTARYYTPSGRSIQADGIEPDIELQRLTVTAREGSDFRRLREADLKGRLDNAESREDDEKAAQALAKGEEAEVENEKSLAETDFELFEALNLLKGLAILNAQRR